MVEISVTNVSTSVSEPNSPRQNVTQNVTQNVSQIVSQSGTIVEPGITIIQNVSSILLQTYSPANPIIREDFQQNVSLVREDNLGDISLIDQIKACAVEIKCDDFHGKGSIEDYTLLFDAASKIVSDVKHVQLDVDIKGFQEFGEAADELSLLFEGFTKKIQSVNMIDDTAFLQSILSALKKIVNLSNTFGKFKKTIVATSTIQLSDSVSETKNALKEVKEEIDCALKYIQYFVDPSGSLPNAELNEVDKNVIHRATTTIEAWSHIYENGVSVAMSQNEDIQYIHQSNDWFKQNSVVIKESTSKLRSRYSRYF